MERIVKPGLENRCKELIQKVSDYEWDIVMEDDPNKANVLMCEISIVKDQLALCYDTKAEDDRQTGNCGGASRAVPAGV